MTGVRRLLRETGGQSLVEFALSSMVFFATVFGTIEYGRAVWTYNMVSNLAQEGARYAAVHGSGSASPGTSTTVQTFVQGRAFFTVSSTTTPSPVGAAGSTVSVQVTTSFTPLTGLIPHTTMSLQSTARMIVLR